MAIRASISYTALQASVSSAKPAASITYELANAAGIWTDHDSKNRFFTEEFPLSDVRFNLVEKNVADSYDVTDFRSAATHLPKEETLSLAENFARVVSYYRSFTDAFTLDDLSQIDKDFYGNKGNIFAFTDIIGLTHNKQLTDNYSVGDVFSKITDFRRDFDETVGMADAAPEFVVAKEVVDSVGMGSLLGLLLTLPKTDHYTVTDTPYNSLTKNVVDAFALDDSALINKDYYGNKGNVVGFSETFDRDVVFNREYADITTILDSPEVSAVLSKEDQVAFSDVIVIGWNYYRTVSDILRVHDRVPGHINGGLLNNTLLNTDQENVRTFIDPGAIDTLGFSDVQVSSINKAIADTTSLADVSTLAADLIKADSFTFSDVVSIGWNYERVIYDFLAVHDRAPSSLGSTGLNSAVLNTDKENVTTFIDPGVVDAIGFTEIQISSINKHLVDTFALDDSALVNKNYYGNKGNVISFSDILTSVLEFNRTFTDSCSVSDTNNRSLDKAVVDSSVLTDLSTLTQSKKVSDTVTYLDSNTLQLEKTVFDGIGLDDSALVNKNYFGTKGNIMSISDVVVVDLVVSNTINSSAFNTRSFN